MKEGTSELAAAVVKQDARYGWNLLSDTTRLQIQTIDSLCAALTRQMPVVSGFGGFARVVEDATELYRRAARETLREMAEGSATDSSFWRVSESTSTAISSAWKTRSSVCWLGAISGDSQLKKATPRLPTFVNCWSARSMRS